MNKVIILATLTRDPELRYLPKGTAVCKLGIAQNRKWKTESGEEREDVLFADVDCFGKQAETVAKWFKKGSRMLVEGRLKLDQWEDKKTGEKRSKIAIALESFSFVDRAKTEKADPGDYVTPAAAVTNQDDEQVPF